MSIFIGSQIFKLDTIGSTNDYANTLIEHEKAFDGCVVIAKNQTSGKGQRGNVWIAEPNTNFCLSIVLKDNSTLIVNQFYLNMAIANGVAHFLNIHLSINNNIAIKWPNDILVDKQKIAGILIENNFIGNSISTSVVGIGLNVNQTIFNLGDNARNATSMALCQQKYFNLDELLPSLLTSIEKFVLMFRQGNFIQIKNYYNSNLYLKNIEGYYKYNHTTIKATIVDVSANGKLILSSEFNNLIEVELKEIAFLQ